MLSPSEVEALDVRLEAYRELIRLLPDSNRDTLQFLLKFFRVVADNSEDRVDSDGLPVSYLVFSITDLPRVLGKRNIHGISGFAVNRGFACLQYVYKALSVGRNWPR